MQQLAVYFKSSLYQHMIYHDNSTSRWGKGHKVYREGENRNLKNSGFEVNSHHHQGIPINKLGEDLVPLLYAENEDAHLTGDGDIVEAFRHRTLPIVGYAWHPEEWYDSHSINSMLQLLAG